MTNNNNIIDPSSPYCCNNSRYRRRKKQSQQPTGGGFVILAAISILSLGSGSGTHAHAQIKNQPLTTTTNNNNNSVQNDNINLYESTTSTVVSYHNHNPPLLLNITQIESSPILVQRYDWIRQSSSLVHLLDDHQHQHYQHRVETEKGGQNNNNKGQHDQYYQKRKLDQVYDDDYGNNDDVNSNLYDDKKNNADDVYANADDAALYDDAYQTNDDVNDNDDDTAAAGRIYICEDKTCTINEQCTKFLFGFLEGTTDAKDNCEGIMNAYVAADCGTIKKSSSSSSSSKMSGTTVYNMDDDFNDDYFGIFYDHQCCSSLRSHYYEYCDSSEILNGANLLLVAAVMLLCECAKSIVKKNRIRWLPEAASCMLVGMAVALGAKLLGSNIENIGFDEGIFMYLLLPPIIFEAALSVNKGEFRRRRGAIMVFALFGTLLSSFLTGAATYYSAKYFGDASLSILDSLVFGSLISSIDPVAILSVLTSLKMSETDTIYILVFGESLLNDGIAITLFKSLVQQYESKEAVSLDDILGSIADFLIIACGSCAIGLACGVACLCYFHLNSSILHPVMEVASFFLWAVVPYWISESIECSGIVAIVVMGFFMDMYLRPGWDPAEIELEEERLQLMLKAANHGGNIPVTPTLGLDYYNWDDDGSQDGRFRFRGTAVDIPDIRRPHSAPLPHARTAVDDHRDRNNETSTTGTKKTVMIKSDSNNKFPGGKDGEDADTIAAGSMTTFPRIKSILLKREFVRMSREADEHVRFVAHLLSSLSENAIFAYLGLFLFSGKYKWDGILCSIGVITCILSRAVMVVCASWFIWYMHIFRQRMGCNSQGVDPCIDECLDQKDSADQKSTDGLDPLNAPISKSARALSNYKVQVVLILAGLRGAVSLALVESVPIYNGVTGVGSMNKPLLKAMTSSAIIFTIFVLGGGAYYILKWLDISDDDMLIESTNKRLADRALSGYIYPPLVCGAYNNDDNPAVEMELSTAPSWRNYPRSPGSMIESPRVGYMAPPSPSRMMLQRSRSDWSRTSHDSAGLNAHDHHRDENDIIDRQLNHQLSSKSRGSQSVHTDIRQLNSVLTDAIEESTPELDESSKKSMSDDDPPFPPEIV